MSTKTRFTLLEGLSLFAAISTLLAFWIQLTTGSAEDPWVIVQGALPIVLTCIFFFYYNDLYDFAVVRTRSELSIRLIQALGASALTLAVLYLLFPQLVIASGFTAPSLLIILGLILALRAIFYCLAKSRFSERVLILGAGSLAERLVEQIETRPDLGLTVAGVLWANGVSPLSPLAPRVLGTCRELDQVVERVRPHRVLVAIPERRGQLPIEQLVRCRFQGVIVEEGVTAYERFAQQLAVDALTPSALIFCDGLRRSLFHYGGHRCLSLLVAAIGVILAAPLTALIAVLIKLDCPGPVFFIQPRVGKDGKPFHLIKFRTMREGPANVDSVWHRDNRSRITRVGRILRKSRLDELPQFFNILKGDMDLVGPRPEMAENVEKFRQEIPFYPLRHTIRPGLTGWAQIRFPYAMSREEVTRKLCYDLYYIKHLSLWFDLRILFDTAKVVLLGRGGQ